ncbi:MAG: hypothetical protein ABJA67_02090 [Chthonomonadales bacterium]
MTYEEQKRMARQQRAGYALHRTMEIERMRAETFDDRLAAFRRVLGFSENLPKNESRVDDDELTRKWIRLRANFDAKYR